MDGAPRVDDPWNVLFTRGQGCAHLAHLLGGSDASRVEGDLKAACITARADVLVQGKSSSFDLVSTVVPHSIDEERRVPLVMGAVGTGPHSLLVSTLTARIADHLGADAMLASASRTAAEDKSVRDTLAELGEHAPGAEQRLVRASAASGLLEALPEDGLLVLGAPGGSWWQRQFFGPGRRLIVKAPAGAVEVQAAPRRCFHAMTDLDALGRLMRAADARAVMTQPAAPIADNGVVIGLIRRHALQDAPDDVTLESMMEEPVFAHVDDPLEVVPELHAHLDGAPVPIIDATGRLVGGVALG